MIATVVLLICGLIIVGYALALTIVNVRNNRVAMSTGVKIDINDEKPVVNVVDVPYEPGNTYRTEFPITNLSAFDVWYRVYFTDVDGVFKEDITVTIKEKDGTVLCQGLIHEIGPSQAVISSLAKGEKKVLDIEFYFSPDATNSAQRQTLSFNITTTATQKINNPQKNFGE